MATIRYGPLVQSARGALGSLVFARQGSRAIVRQRPMPSPHSSTAQLDAQNRYQRAIRIWQALGANFKLEWTRIASSTPYITPDGTPGHLSAFQLFTRHTMRQMCADNSYWPYPTNYGAPLAISDVDLQVWPGGPVNLLFEQAGTYVDTAVILACHPTLRTTSTFPGQLYLDIYANIVAPGARNVTAGLAARVGLPQANQYVRWRASFFHYEWPDSAFFAGLARAPAVSSELITNGDFELDTPPASPAYWSASAGTTLSTVSSPVYGDAVAGRWQGAAAIGAKYFNTNLNIDVSTPGTYTLRFAARTAAATAWNNIQALYTPSGTTTITTDAPAADDAWHAYEYPFTVPAAKILGRIRLNKTFGTATDVYIDNVSLRRDL